MHTIDDFGDLETSTWDWYTATKDKKEIHTLFSGLQINFDDVESLVVMSSCFWIIIAMFWNSLK